MLKLITFDIGGTIIEKDKESRIEKIEQIIGVPRNVFRNDYKEIFCTSRVSLEKMVEQFCKIYNFNDIQKIYDLFQRKSELKINYYVESLIIKLNDEGYKVATISNACFWTYNSLKNTNLSRYITNEFCSFDLGYTKPNKNVFEYVEKIYKLKPYEILHIGDSKNSDYIGAKSNGWNAFLVDNNFYDIYPYINNLK